MKNDEGKKEEKNNCRAGKSAGAKRTVASCGVKKNRDSLYSFRKYGTLLHGVEP